MPRKLRNALDRAQTKLHRRSGTKTFLRRISASVRSSGIAISCKWIALPPVDKHRASHARERRIRNRKSFPRAPMQAGGPLPSAFRHRYHGLDRTERLGESHELITRENDATRAGRCCHSGSVEKRKRRLLYRERSTSKIAYSGIVRPVAGSTTR